MSPEPGVEFPCREQILEALLRFMKILLWGILDIIYNYMECLFCDSVL